MNPWLIAAVPLALTLLPPAFVALRGTLVQRLIAVQLASVIGAVLFVVLSYGFGQPSFLDLALTLVLLSLPGTLTFTLFLERWL